MYNGIAHISMKVRPLQWLTHMFNTSLCIHNLCRSMRFANIEMVYYRCIYSWVECDTYEKITRKCEWTDNFRSSDIIRIEFPNSNITNIPIKITLWLPVIEHLFGKSGLDKISKIFIFIHILFKNLYQYDIRTIQRWVLQHPFYMMKIHILLALTAYCVDFKNISTQWFWYWKCTRKLDKILKLLLRISILVYPCVTPFNYQYKTIANYLKMTTYAPSWNCYRIAVYNLKSSN